MGSTESKNVTSIATEALAESTNNFLQDIQSSGSVTQGIYVSDTGGNVVISGNKQDARVSINMNALQSAMSSQQAQQDLASTVAQSAKALTQDMSLFNFSKAENYVSQYINSTIKLATNVSQSCAASGATTQEIAVNNTAGDVTITNNTQRSLVDVYSNCISDAIAQSSTLQKIQTDIDQDAESTTKGTNLVLLAAIALICLMLPLLIPLFGIGTAFNQVLKIIFPITLLIGIIVLLVWQFNTTGVVTSSGYSRLIENTDDCIAVMYKSSVDYENAPSAVAACEDDDECEGYDFHVYDYNPNTKEAMLYNDGKPETRFYKNFRKSPCEFVTDNADDVKIMAPRFVVCSAVEPSKDNLTIGDVWLRDNTGGSNAIQYSIIGDDGWEPYYDWGIDNSVSPPEDAEQLKDWSPPRLLLEMNKSISWEEKDGGNEPSADIDTDYCLKPGAASGFWNIFERQADGTWVKRELGIPGPKPFTPADRGFGINYSGFKSHQKNNIYLYIAIGLMIFGAVGMAATFIPPLRLGGDKKGAKVEMANLKKEARKEMDLDRFATGRTA